MKRRYYVVTSIEGNVIGLKSIHPEHFNWEPIKMTVPADREILKDLKVDDLVSWAFTKIQDDKFGELKRVSYEDVARDISNPTLAVKPTTRRSVHRSKR